ncbi:hypothetical protein NSERUTF1_6400 [Nocardia seriolae]|nr:hypothetical protein NSERUTF1_6400 [Nocardia seriolae]
MVPARCGRRAYSVRTSARFCRPPQTRLVLQRHSCSGEWVAAASVMGESGLVLSASSESGPGPDMVGPVVTGEDEGDEQAADLG